MNLELDRGRIPFGGEAVGVIPARCASTRFPDKPLALIAGVPMICWTFKSASQAASFRRFTNGVGGQNWFAEVS